MDQPILTETPDMILIRQFAGQRDQRAFAELVQRHGTMVLCVARRQLGNDDDAEDVFQATFLALARNCSQHRIQSNLAGWLFRVAYRTSLKLRQRKRTRQHESFQEDRMTQPDELASVARQHQLRLLDEELQRLPDKYRDPLVRHYILGHSSPQIASALNLTVSSVEGRLKRARKKLRSVMLRRGCTLGAITVVARLQLDSTAVAVPPRLITQTVDSCTKILNGGWQPADRISQLMQVKQTTLGVSAMKASVASVLVATVFLSASGMLPVESLSGQNRSQSLVLNQQQTSVIPSGQDPFARAADASVRFLSSDVPPATTSSARDTVIQDSTAAADDAVLPEENRATNGSAQTFSLHSRSESERKIETALDSVSPLEFIEAPLTDVLDFLADLHGIQIVIDQRKLDELGIAADEVAVTISLPSISTRSGLALILEPHELDCVIQNDVLKVTTREAADEMTEIRVYESDSIGLSPDELSRIVEHTVVPDSWAEVGGNGVIETLPDGLVVTQSQRVHREIVRLLEQLARRKAARHSGS